MMADNRDFTVPIACPACGGIAPEWSRSWTLKDVLLGRMKMARLPLAGSREGVGSRIVASQRVAKQAPERRSKSWRLGRVATPTYAAIAAG